ncbi:hypothetical protein [Klebsiella phage 05F01]|nr:hypothetical protein [Klebsiella phage 05F01]
MNEVKISELNRLRIIFDNDIITRRVPHVECGGWWSHRS